MRPTQGDSEEERGPRGAPAYLELLGRIQRGEVGPNARLVDTALAAELGVSRMPVREALLRLVHEGYLVGTTRGFMLPRLSTRDVADIFEVRRLLEPRAAAQAAQALDTVALAALDLAHRRAGAAFARHDWVGFMEANTAFRRAWLTAVPNARLAATISRFVDHVQTIRLGTLQDLASQGVAMALLDELMAGFRSRDVLGVHDAMARLIDRAEERFFALLPEAAPRAAGRAG